MPMISILCSLFPPLLFPSLLAAFGASIAAGIVGSYIVVKRIVSISGSIAHSILGGVGIALWLQYQFNLPISPLHGAIASAIFVAICIGNVHLKYHEREDSIISMIWSIGMAIGIICISKLPSFNSELSDFLFGNILWVTPQDLYFLGILDLFIVATVSICHTRFLALCFDEKYMALNHYSIKTWYLLLLILTAITTVVLMYVMGVILMLSMLVLPVSIACRFSYKMSHIIYIASILNIVCSFLGIMLAYLLDLPVGPVIAILMGGAYSLSLLLKRSYNASTPSPVSPESKINS
ncbi:metal ABC transporter permease [Chlamydia trachomatis]|uniref:Metal transport system permease protein n=2 Tax=Chlamydia trachomatis TaxID=813 RepID=G4NNF8_CHLT4|nr:metal ABC transporter permease [Chlamydia trachomatis]AAX50686.1 metal transport system permease protein [Chlamydia trachomatis A/HAR-13]AEP35271.1 Metal transport system permease protein [Chlamydia trachomatis A2497]AGR96641.1 metal transporter, membrane permease component [Chlamydia trachomatis RC-J/943]AGR97566.1 metal transporter, membrane permease component [Chlamydia trachomatis RC-J/953]AGS02218.1 metal transporter, membrane permease component [Chlamydia trachomatis J/6276tet1]